MALDQPVPAAPPMATHVSSYVQLHWLLASADLGPSEAIVVKDGIAEFIDDVDFADIERFSVDGAAVVTQLLNPVPMGQPGSPYFAVSPS
jgi:hypothetical protein